MPPQRQPAPAPAPTQQPLDEDECSEESFPASDPPPGPLKLGPPRKPRPPAK